MKSFKHPLVAAPVHFWQQGGVVRIARPSFRKMRASTSKARWLAMVGESSSTSRVAARESSSRLKVTWTWPPADVSHLSDGSAAADWL
jgi:hypothetical protein